MLQRFVSGQDVFIMYESLSSGTLHNKVNKESDQAKHSEHWAQERKQLQFKYELFHIYFRSFWHQKVPHDSNHMTQIIVNRGEWLWNSKFFVVCYCSDFRPWTCTKHNGCLLRTEELTNRNVLVMKFMHSAWEQNKRLCRVVDLPT